MKIFCLFTVNERLAQKETLINNLDFFKLTERSSMKDALIILAVDINLKRRCFACSFREDNLKGRCFDYSLIEI